MGEQATDDDDGDDDAIDETSGSLSI